MSQSELQSGLLSVIKIFRLLTRNARLTPGVTVCIHPFLFDLERDLAQSATFQS